MKKKKQEKENTDCYGQLNEHPETIPKFEPLDLLILVNISKELFKC